MAIQKFNAVDGFSTGLTMTNVIDSGGNISGVAGVFTGTLTGATASFSKLLTASAGVLTDSVVPLVGLGNGGILYLNTAETTGGGGSKTWIGDVNGDNNATYITVDDVAGELFISAGGGIHLYGTIDTNSTAYFGNTVTVGSGGAVLEWDGSFPIPTVLSVYNTLTEANTLTLDASGSFSSLTTSGTVTGVTGAFSKTITVNSQVVSTNARGWFL